ncbi:MAG TPA: PAS domain S-box protein [Rubrivivax sp.]|nr:PAS domain S-box protein [Rubrivivax sp.]
MSRPTQQLRLLHLGAMGIALIIAALVLAAVIYVREQSRREHTDAVQDLAHAVSLSLDAWVDTIDYVLQVSADEIGHQTGKHGADAAAINRFLMRQQERFPYIDLLRATNPDGEALWGRGVDPAQRASLAQREYFQRLRDDPTLGMVIAEPIVGRISQQWIWLMARRIQAPDGSFAGLVYASMFIRDLTRMLQQSNPPSGGVIVLRDAQMRTVASTAAEPAQPGSAAPSEAEARHLAELQSALRAQPAAGTFVGQAPDADDRATVYAYRRNPTHGYTLLVGQPLAAADAQWQALAMVLLGLLAASAVGALFFVKATTRGWEQAALADTLALREREHGMLKSLIRTIPDLVWLKDPQGVYLACNAAFERFMGRSEADLLGKSDLDLMDREQAEFFRDHDRKALAAGQPTVNEEWVTYASDGRRVLLKTTKAPMHAPDGTLTGVLGIAHDITEQRRAEDSLHASEALLNRANTELEARVAERTSELLSVNRQLLDTQFAMEGVGIGITWVDFETGRFIWANRHAAEVLGYTREEMLRMTVSDIDPNFPPEAYAAVMPTFLAEGQLRFETEHRTRDGQRIPVEMTIYYDHRDSAMKPRLIAFSSSIAARKEAERTVLEAKAAAEAASRAKSSFLANMSHEIRTPLNAMLGLSHLLRSDVLSPLQRERLDKMVGAGRHLLSIISDILDLSKVEAGRLQLEAANFHLSAVLDNVCSMVSDAAAAKGLELQVDPDGVPLWLRGDATRLRQALLNFAGNAVKFTDSGRVTLRALLVEDRGQDIVVRFEVQDTGPGLSPQQRERLFQPFEQVDGSAARRHGGTGLGLALNKRLIELMRGSIGVDSDPGHGCTFWFVVPLQRGHGPMPEAGLPVPAAGADERLRQLHRGARVLLAEDNEINVEVVQELLHAVGLDVVVAGNGRAAVEAAQQDGFDLILMDMQMPEMDGLEATRRIRQLHDHAATPILALTANAFTDDRQACLGAGMDTMLTKPVDPALLYESLLQWLAQGAQRRSSDAVQTATPPSVAPTSASTRLWLRLQAGVDVDRALPGLSGNTGRLVELLRKFVGQHAQDPALVLAELDAGSRDAARQRMHRFKGAAAQLGLTVGAAEAARIEAALQHEPGNPVEAETVAEATARLDEAIIALVRALDSAGPDRSRSGARSSYPGAS